MYLYFPDLFLEKITTMPTLDIWISCTPYQLYNLFKDVLNEFYIRSNQFTIISMKVCDCEKSRADLLDYSYAPVLYATLGNVFFKHKEEYLFLLSETIRIYKLFIEKNGQYHICVGNFNRVFMAAFIIAVNFWDEHGINLEHLANCISYTKFTNTNLLQVENVTKLKLETMYTELAKIMNYEFDFLKVNNK